MEFFDKTQDVIDIQLTPYGKQKLSEGDFSPEYYSFYDSGILYDGAYGPISESQNDIVDRIKSTPQMKAQSFFSASSPAENYSPTNINYDINNLTTANSKFFRFLGTNSPWSNYAPSWNIKTILNSKVFSGPVKYKSELSIPTFFAPLTASYTNIESQQPDGTVYIIDDIERLLIDVSEINTIKKGRGNFDIEIFEVSDDGQNKLTKLHFINEGPGEESLISQTQPYEVVGTLQGTREEIREEFPKLDTSYVEYFLSVRVDDEIIDIPSTPGVKLYKDQYNTTPAQDVCDDVEFPEVD